MSRLLDFYFGNVEDAQRLQIERELLEDPETLTAYLDLKRAIEQAAILPLPSAALGARLLRELRHRPARVLIPFSIGLALAAGLAFLLFLAHAPRSPSSSRTQDILFDGPIEPSAESGVL